MKKIFIYLIIGLCFISCNVTMVKENKYSTDNEIVANIEIPNIKFLKENKPLECRVFRLRVLKFLPGAKTAIHSHEDRPEVFSIIEGDRGALIHIYNNDDLFVPYGGSNISNTDIVHYAENLSKNNEMLMMVGDLLDDGSECNGKIYPQHTPLLDKLKADNDYFYTNSPTNLKDNEVVNIEYFRTNISDIILPKGTTDIKNRSLRIRKIALKKNMTLKEESYINRPSYIMVLDGEISISINGISTKKISSKQAISLINIEKVKIINSSDTDSTYFLIELWDNLDDK